MRVSELLNEGVRQFLENMPSMQDHMADTQNPHAVTKEDVGLSRVTNDLQAKDADFRSHKHAAVLDHPAGSVTAEKLAPASVTAEKIAKKAVCSEAITPAAVGEAHLSEAVRAKISGKVDKEEGMGLSENSFTDAEKNKLGMIQLTEEGALTVDTGAMLLKTEPLRLMEAGKEYRDGGEETIASDAAAFISAGGDMAGYVTACAYENRAGRYTLAYKIAESAGFQTVVAPENTTCHTIAGGKAYFGRVEGGKLEIWETTLGGSGSPSLYRQVALTKSDGIDLRHIFYKRWAETPGTDEGGRSIFTAVYFSASHDRMYVDAYKDTGYMDPPIDWSFSIDSEPLTSYAASYAGTVYDRRFPVAATDEGGNIYIAPVESSEAAHAVLRLSPEGEITGRYRPLPTTKSEGHVAQGIAVEGEDMYVFHEFAQVYRYRTESGVYKRVLFAGGGQTERFLGLAADKDGRVHLLTRKTDGSGTCLRCGTGDSGEVYKEGTGSIATVVSEMPQVAVSAADGAVSTFRLSADGTIKRHVYRVNRVYTVL